MMKMNNAILWVWTKRCKLLKGCRLRWKVDSTRLMIEYDIPANPPILHPSVEMGQHLRLVTVNNRIFVCNWPLYYWVDDVSFHQNNQRTRIFHDIHCLYGNICCCYSFRIQVAIDLFSSLYRILS